MDGVTIHLVDGFHLYRRDGRRHHLDIKVSILFLLWRRNGCQRRMLLLDGGVLLLLELRLLYLIGVKAVGYRAVVQ